MRRLYNWALTWAETKYGVPALALISFTESSFFPIPPDPLLIALCLGKPKKSFWYAAVCSVMSVLGGLLGYLIGWAAWEVVNGFFFTYIFSPSAFEFVSARYQENAFISILGAAFTPIPFKVFTVAAGIFQINLLVLIVASTIGRSARFFIEAGLIYYFGEGVKSLIDKYFNILSILFFILIVLGIIAVKYAL